MPVYSLQANLQDKAERLRLALLYSDILKKKLFTVVTVAQELPSPPPWLTVSMPQFELISQPCFTFSLCGNGVLCTLSYSSFAFSIGRLANSALPFSDNMRVNVKGNSGTSHKTAANQLNYRKHATWEDKRPLLPHQKPILTGTEHNLSENVYRIVFPEHLWMWILNNKRPSKAVIILSVSKKKANIGTQWFHPTLLT